MNFVSPGEMRAKTDGHECENKHGHDPPKNMPVVFLFMILPQVDDDLLLLIVLVALVVMKQGEVLPSLMSHQKQEHQRQGDHHGWRKQIMDEENMAMILP